MKTSGFIPAVFAQRSSPVLVGWALAWFLVPSAPGAESAAPGLLHFSQSVHSVSESDGEVILTVVREGGSNGVVAAEFFVAGGTSTAADYYAASGQVTLLDSELRKSFVFRLVTDALPEGPETIVLGLRNPSGGASVSSATATVTVLDGEQTVSACDEPGLRTAVAAGGRVSLTCDGTIFLTSPLVLSNGLTLDASGHHVSLSGGSATRLLIVQPGVSVTLRHLALVDGLALGTNGSTGQPGEPAQGGAVLNRDGVVKAYDCAFLGHRAQGGIGGESAGGFPSMIGSGGGAYGGAICNWLGWFNASNCVFSSNRAEGGKGGTGFGFGYGGEARGGALCNLSGVVQMARTVLSNNVALSGQHRRHGGLGGSATAVGGAIYDLGELTLASCRFQDNAVIAEFLSPASGGAIFHESQNAVRLADCVLAKNRALGGAGLLISTPMGLPGGSALGGGLHLAAGVAGITNSTFQNNLAVGGAGVPSGAGAGQGGGVFNAASVSVLNCTFSGNLARGGAGRASPSGHGEGGGLYTAANGRLTLTHATLGGNAAESGAGGYPGQSHGSAIATAGGLVTLRNTILAQSLSGSNCYGGAFMDEGGNLSSDASCPFTAPGSIGNIDPLLGPLADYGGPTPTMTLLAGSPALNAANPAFAPPTDQRGRARPSGVSSDIGAVESSAPYTVVGHISGYLSNPITVSSGLNSGLADAGGLYSVQGFTPGAHVLTPASLECLFVLSNRLVDVGPDVAGVDFHSYRSNALVLERLDASAVRGVFAGEAGATYRVLASPDLSAWAPWSTNTVEPSGLFEFIDNMVPPRRFFQVVQP